MSNQTTKTAFAAAAEIVERLLRLEKPQVVEHAGRRHLVLDADDYGSRDVLALCVPDDRTDSPWLTIDYLQQNNWIERDGDYQATLSSGPTVVSISALTTLIERVLAAISDADDVGEVLERETWESEGDLVSTDVQLWDASDWLLGGDRWFVAGARSALSEIDVTDPETATKDDLDAAAERAVERALGDGAVIEGGVAAMRSAIGEFVRLIRADASAEAT
jgi:hypothetical protein